MEVKLKNQEARDGGRRQSLKFTFAFFMTADEMFEVATFHSHLWSLN